MAPGPGGRQAPSSDDKHFVFADFEKADDNKKPISARGGAIRRLSLPGPRHQRSRAKGPELVHIKRDDPNHLLKFDYALFARADWTGVTLEIHGQPDVDGKMVPDDLSGYKMLSLDCYETGVADRPCGNRQSGTRARRTRSSRRSTPSRCREGLNTYKIPLKAFSQPRVGEGRARGSQGNPQEPHVNQRQRVL